MKVLVVAGTRPEVIKLAPVIAALRPLVETIVCTTGQHREVLAQALDAFRLRPDITLDVMAPGQPLNQLAARLIGELDGVLEAVAPEWVLVQGDTTSAFCAGYAAFQRGAKVGHVEAGLRTRDLASPFPEEANRQFLARIASRHFAPTLAARDALLDEGIAPEAIVVTGNTVVDALAQWVGPRPANRDNAILITCHRREIFDRLDGICEAVATLARIYPDHRLVLPLHHDPVLRRRITERLSGFANIELTGPLSYVDTLQAIACSSLVITDSGGIQEEAPSFGTPVVVIRDRTERRDGIDAGFAVLAGTNPAAIVAAARGWLDEPARAAALALKPNPYGDGRAAERIVGSLLNQSIEPYRP